MSVTPCVGWIGDREKRRRVWVVQPSVCSEVTQLVMALPPLTLTYMIEPVDGHTMVKPRAPNEHVCYIAPPHDHQAGIG